MELRVIKTTLSDGSWVWDVRLDHTTFFACTSEDNAITFADKLKTLINNETLSTIDEIT